MSKLGRMVKIDDFIKELQDTRAKFGNTCVYIRDVSWGGLALNRELEDRKSAGVPILKKEERDAKKKSRNKNS